jgi:trans-aconitate methyltransferase
VDDQLTPTSPAAPPAVHEPASNVDHWNSVYQDRGPTQVSWFQHEPQPSLDLITALAGDRRDGVIDVGGGASPLAARLAGEGFTDVTVLDVSSQALQHARDAARHLVGADAITWIRADLLIWRPDRTYRIWHDRAVFHFLTDPADRVTYLTTLRAALADGGTIVLGTFAPSGPTHCSGLPVARYSPDELATQLAAVLGDKATLVGARTYQHHTPAGGVQPFTWITARLR